jgi:hypothetical protein
MRAEPVEVKTGVVRSVLAAVAVMLLTGCQPAVTTVINVSSPTAASTAIVVTVEGEARDAVLADPTNESRLIAAITAKTNTTPRRDDSGSALTYSSDVTYAQLTALSGFTGVQDATLNATGSDATVTITWVVPVDLEGFLDELAGTGTDAGSVRYAMRGATSVSVLIRFPGAVTAVDGPGLIARDGNQVQVSQYLGEFATGTVQVTGSTTAPLITPVRVGGAALVVMVIGLAVVIRRRR